jgi:DNA-binding YbaB/EbfC family protein
MEVAMAKIPNMDQLFKMAQNLSKQMEDQLNDIEEEGNSGGGMVKVVLNGHKQILSLSISKEVVDPDDIEMLQDLITAAVNDACSKVDGKVKSNLGGSLPGGMPPGFQFPGL